MGQDRFGWLPVSKCFELPTWRTCWLYTWRNSNAHLPKAGFLHMRMREGNHSALLWRDATGKAERKRANRSLPVPNLPPTPGKSQAIQHLQVKLLGIAMVTKLGDLQPEPVPPKSCGAVGEGKEKYLKKTSSGTGS